MCFNIHYTAKLIGQYEINSLKIIKKCSFANITNFSSLAKESDEIVRSYSGYVSCSRYNLVYLEDSKIILEFQNYLKGILIKVSNSILFTLV